MRLSRLCGVLALLVLLTSAGAALNLGISSDKEWLVAGGDSAKVSLEIQGGTGPFTITASAAPSGMCTVNPTSSTSTSNKPPLMEVKSLEKSGVCELTVSVTDANGNTGTRQFLQKIDHSTPMNWERIAPMDASVGTVVPVGVRIRDVHGNLVDNRNIVESVIFSTNGGSGFVKGPSARADTRTESTTAQVNENGVASVYYYVGSFTSPNYITVIPPGEIGPKIITIVGTLNGIPSSLVSRVSPVTGGTPWMYADGSSKFIIIYTVLDTNGFLSSLQGSRCPPARGPSWISSPMDSARPATITAPSPWQGSIPLPQPWQVTRR
jgi:hypothetical protein